MLCLYWLTVYKKGLNINVVELLSVSVPYSITEHIRVISQYTY